MYILPVFHHGHIHSSVLANNKTRPFQPQHMSRCATIFFTLTTRYSPSISNTIQYNGDNMMQYMAIPRYLWASLVFLLIISAILDLRCGRMPLWFVLIMGVSWDIYKLSDALYCITLFYCIAFRISPISICISPLFPAHVSLSLTISPFLHFSNNVWGS
jgi:hypothetical protein